MRILHPTDFSRTAEKALVLARDVARRSGGSLHIIHVQQRFENRLGGRSGPAFDTLNPALLARLEEARKQEVRTVQERLAFLASDGATHELRWGVPLREVLDASEDTDLIVMGAHGANRFDAAFLGGLAGRVVRRSHVPVMTVRDEAEDLAVGRLLVAVDFDDAGHHAWAWARTLARHGVELVLTHVLDDRRERSGTDRASRATEAMTRMAGGAAARHILREGDPVRVLPALAQEIGAGAICVGMRRRAGAVGLMLGSRADALLRSSPVPILSVPYRAASTGDGPAGPA